MDSSSRAYKIKVEMEPDDDESSHEELRKSARIERVPKSKARAKKENGDDGDNRKCWPDRAPKSTRIETRGAHAARVKMETSDTDESSKEATQETIAIEECKTLAEKRPNACGLADRTGKKRKAAEDAEVDQKIAERRAVNRKKAQRFRDRHKFIQADLKSKVDAARKENAVLKEEKEVLAVQNRMLKEEARKMSRAISQSFGGPSDDGLSVTSGCTGTTETSIHGAVESKDLPEGLTNNNHNAVTSNVDYNLENLNGRQWQLINPTRLTAQQPNGALQIGIGSASLLATGADAATAEASFTNTAPFASSANATRIDRQLPTLQTILQNHLIAMSSAHTHRPFAMFPVTVNDPGQASRDNNNQLLQQTAPAEVSVSVGAPQLLLDLFQAIVSSSNRAQQSSDGNFPYRL